MINPISAFVMIDPKRPQIITYGSPSAIVFQVQKALVATGASLVQDGIFGTMTEAAVKRFQGSERLNLTGYVGPRTATRLDQYLVFPIVGDDGPDEAGPTEHYSLTAPWVAKVRALTGVREVPGSPSSETILGWRATIARAFPLMADYTGDYTNDGIPWCGFFMGYVMASVGIMPAWGPDATDRFMYARAWSRWGTRLDDPAPGCIMVFSRAGGGHVSMLEKLSGDSCYIRGGNQQDMVNVSKKSMDTFVAAVWPPGYAMWQVAGDVSNAIAGGSEA
jgi:uncharacterized protein (TIGR02594 family)